MKIVLSGGGTGGHIYPALALREYILKMYPDAEFLYIGTEKGLESRIVREQGIPFEAVKVQGIRRSLSLQNLKTLWYAFRSISEAKKILKAFKPDMVIGTGGYVCGPVLYAAAKLGLPTMIHEQNSVAGVTNKVLSRYATYICTCFEEVNKDFSRHLNKIILTGNPRGQELVELETNPRALEDLGLRSDLPTVLIFGGSRGAMNLNQHFVNHYQRFAGKAYQVLMVTGNAHYDKIVSQLNQELTNVKVVPYLNNMADILKQIDLVACRSGATTLAEITALGVASVLIPSPYVTNNHQEKNARTLVDNQAADLVLESELEGPKLTDLIDELMSDADKRHQMAAQAKEMGIVDASKRLLAIIEKHI